MNKISNSELEIIKVLWEKEGMTSPEIIEALSQKTNWGKTTIKTLISRLVAKGAIEQCKREKGFYVYRALITEREYKKSETENLLAKLYKGSVNNMLLNFVEEKKIAKKDLEKLLEMIEKE